MPGFRIKRPELFSNFLFEKKYSAVGPFTVKLSKGQYCTIKSKTRCERTYPIARALAITWIPGAVALQVSTQEGARGQRCGG
jgi:hypothetical protein